MFWGLISQVQILKVGMSNKDFKAYIPREKLQFLSPFLIVGHLATGWVYGKNVSQPFLPALMFLFVYLSDKLVTLLVFGVFIFSEEIVPYVAVDSVYLWKEMNSGSSYIGILNQNP